MTVLTGENEFGESIDAHRVVSAVNKLIQSFIPVFESLTSIAAQQIREVPHGDGEAPRCELVTERCFVVMHLCPPRASYLMGTLCDRAPFSIPEGLPLFELGAQHLRDELDAETRPFGNGQHTVLQVESLETAHLGDVRRRRSWPIPFGFLLNFAECRMK